MPPGHLRNCSIFSREVAWDSRPSFYDTNSNPFADEGILPPNACELRDNFGDVADLLIHCEQLLFHCGTACSIVIASILTQIDLPSRREQSGLIIQINEVLIGEKKIPTRERFLHVL